MKRNHVFVIVILLLALGGLGWFLWARFSQQPALPQSGGPPAPARTPTTPVLYFIPDVNANCREGPSTGTAVLAVLEAGEPYRVFGVNLGASWLFISTGLVQCWVSNMTGEVMGRTTWVPLITAESGPAPSSEGIPGGSGDGTVAGGPEIGTPVSVAPSVTTVSSGTRAGSGTIDLGINNAFFDSQGMLWATVINNGPGGFNASITIQCTIWYQVSQTEPPVGVGGSMEHSSVLEPGQTVEIQTDCALDPRQGAYYGASTIIFYRTPDSNPDNDLFTLQP